MLLAWLQLAAGSGGDGARAVETIASRLRVCRASLLAAALLCAATTVFAAAVYHVAQRNRAFSAGEITVARGDSIAFGNEDEFIHQIYVDSKLMDFDSREQYPGETITVTFDQSGTFPIRCHIHPKMLLIVHVK
jgi:plastocyanin